MKLGWLWLSILNTTASPSPISMTPAFSPGPWITQGALVGSVRRWIFEDLYEQCSFHMAEKMPCSATSSGVILGSFEATGLVLQHEPEKWIPVFGKDHAPSIG